MAQGVNFWRTMSLISRLGLHISNGLSKKSLFSAPIASKSLLLNWDSSRNYAQPALQEEEEELEMIDQTRLPADYDPATFDPTEHRSPPTQRVFRLVDEVTGLTLMEIQQLSMILRKKLSMEQVMVAVMKAGAAVGVAGLGAKGAGPAAKEEKKVEKTVFELKLEAFEAASKIKIIKEVRSFTDLGLKEAKDLVEKTPAAIKSGVSKEEAEKIIEKMKALGAKVVME